MPSSRIFEKPTLLGEVPIAPEGARAFDVAQGSAQRDAPRRDDADEVGGRLKLSQNRTYPGDPGRTDLIGKHRWPTKDPPVARTLVPLNLVWEMAQVRHKKSPAFRASLPTA
jgi:hypothetical protein